MRSETDFPAIELGQIASGRPGLKQIVFNS